MTAPSTPTSTMKEAERLVDALLQAERTVADALIAADVERESRVQEAAYNALLAFIRSLVEAQPSAVAGEAVRMLTDKEMGDVVERSDGAEHSDDEFAHAAIRKFCEVNGLTLAAPSAVLPLKGEVPTPARDVLPAKCAGCERRCSGCPVSHPDSTMKG